MFSRLKKVFSKPGRRPQPDAAQSSMMAYGPVSEWAATQGFAFSVDGSGHGMALEGRIGGKPWRLQLGKPTRNYIVGEEVRARGDLALDESLAVLVMNRPLKEALEKRAYQMYTDQLQTSVDTSLPEEMRWLAMFEEVGWPELPSPFWDRYAVMSDSRDTAMKWIEPQLAMSMLQWPTPGPSAEVPFLVMLMNGKVYLRMEYTPSDMMTLQHAAVIFTKACESALHAFKTPA